MSVQAITWAIERQLPPTQKLILICLANYACKDGIAYPGQQSLAKDTGLSLRAIVSNLFALERSGHISRNHRQRTNGTRTSDSYQLQLSNVHEMHKDDKSNVHLVPTQCAPAAPPIEEPSVNRQLKEKIPKRKNSEILNVLEKSVGQPLAGDILEHRQVIKKPLTVRAAKLLVRAFEKYGDPVSAAETMIARGWQGFESSWMPETKPTAARRKFGYPGQ